MFFIFNIKRAWNAGLLQFCIRNEDGVSMKSKYLHYTVFESSLDGGSGIEIGVSLRNGVLTISKTLWEGKAESKDDDIELFMHVGRDELKKIESKLHTGSAEETVRVFGEHFVRFGDEAYDVIREWLEKKGIMYETSCH